MNLLPVYLTLSAVEKLVFEDHPKVFKCLPFLTSERRTRRSKHKDCN